MSRSSEARLTSAYAQLPDPPDRGERDDAAPVALGAADVVLIRDSWNKFLAFDDMLIEMFFERLLLDAPALVEQFGLSVDQAPREFARLFDLAIRGLDRATEVGLKEGYREAPAARKARSETLHDCGTYFAAYGMTPAQWDIAASTFLWAMGKAPYLEEYDRADLQKGPFSALGRFFALHVRQPMVEIAVAEDAALGDAVIIEMLAGADHMLSRPQEAGIFFYQTLFRSHPEVLRHFRTADMDMLSRHLIETVVFLGRAAGRPGNLRTELRHLASVHQVNQIPTEDYAKLAGPLLETISTFGAPLTPAMRLGWEVLFRRVMRVISEPMAFQERLVEEARTFLDQIAAELEWSPDCRAKRWSEITHEIRATGTYTQTFEELEHGARMAWRNAPKCIGRISWKNLVVRDCRHVSDPDTMFAECRAHLDAATNGGNIEIVMTVFRPTRPQERWGPRIWNSQLVRYAAYRDDTGAVIGDRANIDLTAAIRKLGWQPPADRGHFDILPVVIDVPGHEPRLYEWQDGEVLEVPISHPGEPGLAGLGLRWCAVPAIANFRLEIGGIDYGCLPFNGWFMGTEIARNLWEDRRYDRAEEIAAVFGLDTSSGASLWRDRAFLELNVAVIHSFQQARITLVDHQTASRQFMIHDQREKRAGRECPAQWSWIAPAAGGSTTPVWHHEMRDFHLSPTYSYAADRWAVEERDLCPMQTRPAATVRTRRPLILYASETGTAEGYARQAARRLSGLAPLVLSMDEVDVDLLRNETCALVIASTCRDGDIPATGRALLDWLNGCERGALEGFDFAVLGIGNRIYPNFCAAAVAFDQAFSDAGARRRAALETADEIAGQADTVKQWLEMFVKLWQADAAVGPTAVADVRVELVADAGRATPPLPTARIAFNAEMIADGRRHLRSTRHIGFDLGAEGPAFRAGDHIAVHPENPSALVAGVIRHLGYPPDAVVRIVGGADSSFERYREPVVLADLLARDLDLSMPAAPEELMRVMRAVSSDMEDQRQLERWIATLDRDQADKGRRQLTQWLVETYHTVLDLFDAFPDCVPSLDVLVDLLPRIRPRLYSIGSSPLVHPGQPRVMAGVLSEPRGDGRVRKGLCSHYLQGLEPGSGVHVEIKRAGKGLPDRYEGPLLMVGAGTGLSPLFGMLEDRVARGVRSTAQNPVALYFGCRDESEFLQRQQLMDWRRDGYLGRLSVALSRQGGTKAYVQDAIDSDGSVVWDILRRPDCRFVICGDAKMAQDVEDRLMQILRREIGDGYASALEIMRGMKAEGRYIEDVWGVQLNRAIALPEMVRTKYDQGSGWLGRIQQVLTGRLPDSGSILRY